jgi:hypothetical protein
VTSPATVPIVGNRLAMDAWRGLERLAVLHEERRLLDHDIEALVGDLASVGITWAEIGRALRMTRQGARQRYGSQVAATTVVVSAETSV